MHIAYNYTNGWMKITLAVIWMESFTIIYINWEFSLPRQVVWGMIALYVLFNEHLKSPVEPKKRIFIIIQFWLVQSQLRDHSLTFFAFCRNIFFKTFHNNRIPLFSSGICAFENEQSKKKILNEYWILWK